MTIRDSLAQVQGLKPCPFCGGGAYWRNGRCEPSFYVACKNCETIGPVTITLDTAINAWNTRHGAGDAERSAELTTAWMAGAESVRDRAARNACGVIGYVGLITPSQRGAPDDATIVVHTKIRHLEGLGDKLLSGPVMISAIDAARAGERGAGG